MATSILYDALMKHCFKDWNQSIFVQDMKTGRNADEVNNFTLPCRCPLSDEITVILCFVCLC